MASEATYETYDTPSESPAEEESDSSDSGPPPVPSLVANRFRVRERIGSGSYSVVYRGVDKQQGDKVAVKFEWTKAEKGRRLLAEARIYEHLGRGKDVPFVRWAGRQGPYNAMVMELQGPSLDDRFTACGKKFSLKTVLMLGEQMIDRIEFVHSRGIVHRDIKPHNFLMGTGDARDRVVIMDFGLAKRYRDPETGRHIPCVEHRGVTGTVRYASLNVHEGLEPSRRDDLEAICYVLLHFLRGQLPWQGLKASSKRSKHEKIRRCKQKTSVEELCKGYPAEFAAFLRHCRSLQYADCPDYEYLRGLLRGLFSRERFRRDGVWDWTEAPTRSTSSAGTVEQSGEARRQEPEPSRRRQRSESDQKAVPDDEHQSPAGFPRRTHENSPRPEKHRGKKHKDGKAHEPEAKHRDRRRVERKSGRS